MLINEKGQMCGVISGGCIEKEILIPVFDKHHHEFMTGMIKEYDFWHCLCAELGIDPPDKGRSLIREALEEAYKPKNKVQELLREIQKTEIMTGLLSDAEKPSVQFFYDHIHPLFDAVVFSSMVGTEKPEKHIYKILVKELGVNPEEIIFFDDRIENVEAAKEFGIKAYQVTEANEMRKILVTSKILK